MAMLPLAVSVGNRLNRWNTKPILWRRSLVRAASLIAVRSFPSTSTLPREACANPPMTYSSDDFPQPDGPMTATDSPGLHFEVHPAQRRHLHLARAIELPQVFRLEYRLHAVVPWKNQSFGRCPYCSRDCHPCLVAPPRRAPVTVSRPLVPVSAIPSPLLCAGSAFNRRKARRPGPSGWPATPDSSRPKRRRPEQWLPRARSNPA